MINDKQLITNVHAAFGFIKNCDEQNYKEFLSVAIPVQLKKGDYICEQGGECSHLALMLEGTARIFKLAETGREITLYRLETGQSCILTASCIQSDNPFPAFAICESNIEAILIPADFLQKWLAESTVWRRYIFGLVAQRMSSVISLVEEVAFHKLDQRIAGLLVRYQNKNPSLLITMTHNEIALELGTSREVVSRILIDFQSAGLVQLTRGSIAILNQKELINRAGN
jgi:CRP/FNR family transcriptional regulator, anaerobic regulatory protein